MNPPRSRRFATRARRLAVLSLPVALLWLGLPTSALAQPTYKLGVYTHVKPLATLKLDGNKLSRTEVKDDPGFRLQYHFLKEGKELATIDARANPTLELPHKEAGTYTVALEVFYPTFKGSGQKGEFKAVSNVISYRLQAGPNGTMQVVVIEQPVRRTGWRRTEVKG